MDTSNPKCMAGRKYKGRESECRRGWYNKEKKDSNGGKKKIKYSVSEIESVSKEHFQSSVASLSPPHILL